MKKFILVALVAASIGAKAQNPNKIIPQVARELTATKMGENLLLTWKSDQQESRGYWEVQGSEDGRHFKMLGLVMGSDPSTDGSVFKFKQTERKLIPGLKFYRVLLVENESAAIASQTIGLSK